ncbi:hypothetical protein BD779DRAFT_1527473 [Infundibulicybe gibba]|nr:hypothetical protein BD779DRAFT_1527473 [Infundibulicybe gibba]
MPASYGRSTFNAKTYGRKSLTKRKLNIDEDSDAVPDALPSPPAESTSVKRPRVSLKEGPLEDSTFDSDNQVSPVSDSSKRLPRTGPTESFVVERPTLKSRRSTGTAEPRVGGPDPQPQITSSARFPPPKSSRRRNGIAVEVVQPLASASKVEPVVRQARTDSTEIFDSITHTIAPAHSPGRLSKRMLARSKTDPSSNTTSDKINAERTSSLPSLSQTKSVSLSTIEPPLPALSIPVPVPTLPVPAPPAKTARTYAGKSRSFLVSVPAPGSSHTLPADAELEDEYSTRESYASLRTRWGVDDSEDDPYSTYAPPSPSSANASPAKGAKGKSKAGPSLLVAPPLPAGMMNPLKSITELRSKGESRRFLDDVGYLFEGMDANSGVGLRRASALEIITKLCDLEFARKAKAADFLSKTWDVFGEAGAGRGEDKVLDTLLIFFTALVARDPTSLSELAQRPLPPPPPPHKRKETQSLSLVDVMFTLFKLATTNSSDPLMLISPESNFGDAELHTSVCNHLSTVAVLFLLAAQISTPLLISLILHALPPSLIHPHHLPPLLISLRSLLPVPLTQADTLDGVHLETIAYHLGLLDTFLLHQWKIPIDDEDEADDGGWRDNNSKEMEEARGGWMVDGLVRLGVLIEKHSVDDDSARKCMEVALRVLVSLTHENEPWAAKVLENKAAMGLLIRIVMRATNSPIGLVRPTDVNVSKDGSLDIAMSVDDDSDSGVLPSINTDLTHSFDRVCLALGLLTNLVQAADDAKTVVRETRLDPTCTLKRSCIHSCTCPDLIGALEILVQFYRRQLPPPSPQHTPPHPSMDGEPDVDTAADDVDADAAFLRGHLAVLFGLLMRGSLANQRAILAALPSTPMNATPKDDQKQKLSQLTEQASLFVAFYTDISQNMGEEDADSGERLRGTWYGFWKA